MFSQWMLGFENDDIVFCDILLKMDINLKIGLMIHKGSSIWISKYDTCRLYRYTYTNQILYSIVYIYSYVMLCPCYVHREFPKFEIHSFFPLYWRVLFNFSVVARSYWSTDSDCPLDRSLWLVATGVGKQLAFLGKGKGPNTRVVIDVKLLFVGICWDVSPFVNW